MGRPVMVDDGGSIRIKLTDGDGEMDGLIQPQRNHEITPHPSHYTKAAILWLTEILEMVRVDFDPFQEIVISTDLGLNIGVKKQGAKLRIEVTSNTLETVIESKSIKNKRSYNFVNGGRINQVECDGTTQAIPDSAFYAAVVII